MAEEGETYWIDYPAPNGYISIEYTCMPGQTAEEDFIEIVQWISYEFAEELNGEPLNEENLDVVLAEYWEDEEDGIVYRSWHDMHEE